MADIFPGIRLEDLSDDDDDDANKEDVVEAQDSTEEGVHDGDDDDRLTDLCASTGNSDKTSEEPSTCPKGVSIHMWQKFQQLHQRREEIKQRTSRKWQKKSKTSNTQTTEETSADMSSKVSESSGEPCTMHKESDISKTTDSCKLTLTESSSSTSQKTPSQMPPSSKQPQAHDQVEKWADFRPYLNVNDHLKGIDRGKYAPKTRLEEKIDVALSQGDYKEAEDLSDYLSTQQFGKKIVDAIDAKRYTEKREAEEAIKAAKKKKNLQWGFQHKQRWETKGNM